MLPMLRPPKESLITPVSRTRVFFNVCSCHHSHSKSLLPAGKWFTKQIEHTPKCFSRKIDYDIKDGGDGFWVYTTQYYCDPSTATPDIKKECEGFVETCHKTDEQVEKKLEAGEAHNETDWEPLPESHIYYKIWKFNNPQFEGGDSVSLVPKVLTDNAIELPSAKSIMKQVPPNIQDAMTSTGSYVNILLQACANNFIILCCSNRHRFSSPVFNSLG